MKISADPRRRVPLRSRRQAGEDRRVWIDRYEVTIGQYAKFVAWIDKNIGEQHAFDHPKQPKNLSHIPEYWSIYYAQAHRGGAAHSVPISLNSPMITVTVVGRVRLRPAGSAASCRRSWSGKKRRAARRDSLSPGVTRPTPSGPTRMPTMTRPTPEPRAAWTASTSGATVDKQKKDKSPYGVIGMGGNVSEWVVDWVDRFTIIKGGNYSIGLQPLSGRIANRLPDDGQEFIGFPHGSPIRRPRPSNPPSHEHPPPEPRRLATPFGRSPPHA